MRYERSVGKFLQREILAGRLSGKLYSGQWLRWFGRWTQWEPKLSQRITHTGPAYAQPDHFILSESQVLLFECKLTQTEEAAAQLVHLYSPLLRKLYSRPVLMTQVCKNLRYKIGPLEIQHPIELLEYPKELPHTWHWLG